MSDILDKMIADLKEGASRSEGFLRGGHVGVEVARERRGEEHKLANAGGLGAALLGPVGAALGADSGARMQAAGGSLLGGAGGALLGTGLGAGIGALAGNPLLGGALGGLGGGYLGNVIGGQMGGEHDNPLKKLSMFTMSDPKTVAKNIVPGKTPPPPPKKGPPPIPAAALKKAFDQGATTAADHFGVKEALLPLIGSLAGGALLRGGLGMAARRFGGNAVGRAAQGALNFGAKGGWRGNALDMAGSTLGGMAGAQLQGQQG